MGFRHRLALFLVVTLAAVQVLTGLVAYSYLRNSLVERAKHELTAAATVFQRQLGVLSERVADDVQVLSLDYALRQAIAQHDHNTELSALRNHGRRVGATRMMLVDLDGRIAADTGAPAVSGKAFAFSDLLDDSAVSGERTSVTTLNGAVYWTVVAPVRAPVPIAFIAAWIPIDNAMLAKLSSLSDLPLSIALATRIEGKGWVVTARTANGPAAVPLPATATPSAESATVIDRHGGEFFTVTSALATAAGGPPAVAVLGYPLSETLSAYRSIITPVLLFLAFALLLAVAGAMLVVRSVSQPLEALAAGARRIAKGDYTPLPHVGAGDEIGQLSQALDAMTRSIADRESALTATIGELEIARNEAVRANEAKSQFLANMSHELRTPLNAIVGFGEMLHQEVLGPLGVARYREYAADILASGQKLLALVSRMLDLAEVEAGKLSIERKRVSLTTILQQSVASVRAEAKRCGVRLAVCDLERPCAVEGDATKLRQAVTHILHNAIKFTPAGGEVTLGLRVSDAAVTVRIADSGIGIGAEDIEVVTRPFHRLRSALDARHQGAGVGLPYAKSVFELHGGTLTITSALGAGTQAEIRLPLVPAALSDAA
ncbi:MAG TPA: ATP-binding protein [Rhizomicrobium sp.]|nr:ATP-binding protein [Rhizomicrobium sp.]